MTYFSLVKSVAITISSLKRNSGALFSNDWQDHCNNYGNGIECIHQLTPDYALINEMAQLNFTFIRFSLFTDLN